MRWIAISPAAYGSRATDDFELLMILRRSLQQLAFIRFARSSGRGAVR